MKKMKFIFSKVGKVLAKVLLNRKVNETIKELEPELFQRIKSSEELTDPDVTNQHWLTSFWHPVIMLVLALILLIGTFVRIPLLYEVPRFWDIFEIGLGGFLAVSGVEGLMVKKKG